MTPVELTPLEWMGQWWDDEAGMLWNPRGSFDALFPHRTVHLVPPTIWYALGLLGRQADGDVDRALHAFRAVIGCQLDEPGAPWHGTYARFLEFPHPQAGAAEYIGYDPNWRQFVGTGMALAVLEYGELLPAADASAMVASLALAVAGEPPDRVDASYSNIALMRAWLEVHTGLLLDRDDLVERGSDLAGRIVERFDRHDCVDEWNSPTYYGIDLYALRLWATRSSGLRDAGARIERAVWDDFAPWYHASLRNIAGPYTRAYGMDMRRYVAAVGLWIGEVAPAPLPDLGGGFSHSHDLSLAPVVQLLGASPSPHAVEMLRSFTDERQLERQVSSDPERIATAWLGPDLMIGAERGGRRWSARGQYHPVTVHWRDPTSRVRWMRMIHTGPVDAVAGRGQLRVVSGAHARRGFQPTSFLLSAALHVQAERWELPGLTVLVSTDAQFVGAHASGELTDARYEPDQTGMATFELSFF